jgi:hypothetical protein
MIEFRECASCAAKPGAPTLCAACLHNRATINRLIAALRVVWHGGDRRKIERLREEFDCPKT